ncbi:FIMAH domain-containing protein [Micromonospora sp. NPDC003776]
MSAARDLHSAPVDPPTTALPPVRPGGSRHRAPDDGRRLMWLAVGGAAVVALVAVLTLALGGGDDAAPPVAVGTVAPTELLPPDEPSELPSSPASPTPPPTSASPTRARTVDPARLLAALNGTVDGLVRQGELRRNDSQDLRKRLREVERLLAAGDVAQARARLRDFTDRVADLRRRGRLDGSGYDALIAATGELARALPAR